MNNIAKGTIIAIASTLALGFYPAATRGVYAAGGNASLVMLATIWARALTLALYCLIRRQPVFDTKEARRQALISGFFQALTTIGIIGALVFLPGPMVIIIMFSHTLLLLFYLAWRGEAKLDAITLLTTVTALFGLTLVVDLWHTQGEAKLIGLALAVFGTVSTAARIYAFGQQMKTRRPAVVGTEAFLVASLMLTLYALFDVPRLPATATGYFYLALASASLAVGNFGMFYGISYLGAFGWSQLRKLEPVFTAVFSFLLGDVLKPVQYGGMAIVMVSLAVYQIVVHRRSRRLDATPEVE